MLIKMSLLKAFTTTSVAAMTYIKIILALVSFLWFCNFLKITVRRLLFDFHRIFEKITEELQRNNWTFVIKRHLVSNTLITSNPTNVGYILKTNFSNYPKGKRSKSIFDILGDTLFNADHDEWRTHRRVLHVLFSDERFIQNNSRIARYVIEDGFIPVLKHVSENDIVLDLQDLFLRYMFDISSLMTTGYSFKTLRVGVFPENDISKALDEAAFVFFLRHFIPENLWKFQKWLGIGQERSWSKVKEALDTAAAKIIKRKQDEIRKRAESNYDEEGLDALKFFLTEDEYRRTKSALPINLVRDVVVGLIFAARDTSSVVLSWFFWLLSKNPQVESKLLEEFRAKIDVSQNTNELFDTEKLNKLVYLHGALCETLRLFPPVPCQSRIAVKEDVLPSGHSVKKNTRIVISSYAMGRMESVWGKDCLEFKPERWITEEGKLRVESSIKFLAFSSGPRICPGKDHSFARMKAVIVTILCNYDVQVVEGQVVSPVSSAVLYIKNGLKVRITKRNT